MADMALERCGGETSPRPGAGNQAPAASANCAPPVAAWQVGALLATTSKFLSNKGSASPRLDAELLLARVLGLSKVQLYVNFERELSPADLCAYRELVRRRAAFEPVAYILGEKEFYGQRLKCTAAALIPRPETEHLVDEALRLAKENWPGQRVRLADIGCGGGAISLALAKCLPEAEIEAVDISPEALALAAENAAALKLEGRINFNQGSLMEPLEGSFNLLCANLPYIPSCEMPGLMPDVGRHEPHLALDGGPEGLDLIVRLLEQGSTRMEDGGRALLEIWPASLASLEKKAADFGWRLEGTVKDLAGHHRIAIMTR